MRVVYDVCEEEVWTDGVCAEEKSYVIILRHGRKILRRVSNVFSNLEVAKDFTSLCNRNKLDPIHLDCVIADYLYAN